MNAMAWLIGSLGLAGDAAACSADEARTTWVVSEGRGDDATADGSEARPFATLTAAFRAVTASTGPAKLVVESGLYVQGERFPLTVDRDVVVAGRSSGVVRIEAASDQTLFEVSPEARLSAVGWTLSGARCAVHAASGATVTLRDVILDDCLLGVELDATGQAFSRLTVSASRWMRCSWGVRAVGAAPWSIALDEVVVEAGRVGLALDGGDSVRPTEQSLNAHRCTFEGLSDAAVRRSGAARRSRAGPWTFTACVFRANALGLDAVAPSGALGLVCEGTVWTDHRDVAVRLAGGVAPEGRGAHFNDCTWRRNASAVQANDLSSLVADACTFASSLGDGLRVTNDRVDQSEVRVSHCVFREQAASGVHLQTGARRAMTARLEHNTFVGNDYGLSRKDKSGGVTEMTVLGCLFAEHRRDLVRVPPEAITSTWRDEDGDPGFAHRDGVDLRLHPESPCRDRVLRSAPMIDRTGVPRTDERADLGAYEVRTGG